MAEQSFCQASADSGHQSEDEAGCLYGGSHDSVREQDRLLPIANVSRIMKKGLPADAKISKEAKEAVQECVSEYISFITGEASDKCQKEKRKTVNGEDLLWALGTLGFEDYLEPLKVYLQKYREIEGERAIMAKQGEQGMAKDVGAVGPSALMGSNGFMNSGGMAGSMQMMQSQGGCMYPQHQYVPVPYQMQPRQGGGVVSRPVGGGSGQMRGM